MKLVIINVGLSGVGRGIIFPDRSFVFFPLNTSSNCKKLPRYDMLDLTDFSKSKFITREDFTDLTLGDIIPKFEQERAHNDPDFQDRTYGHARRGFGYETLLGSMARDDVLLFLATLNYRSIRGERRNKAINPDWGAYLVGAFIIENVYSHNQFQKLRKIRQKRFLNNPHYYCRTGAHMWIEGKKGEYGLFKKAVPLSSSTESTKCIPFLQNHFRSSGGKPAGSAGWYRAAFACAKNSRRVWKRITASGNVPIPNY